MDLKKVLAQLHAELAYLDAAITSLEHLKQERPRRGRPPKVLTQLKRVAEIGTHPPNALRNGE